MLKNADMPAMPMPTTERGQVWTAQDLGGGFAEQCRPAFGLTKREALIQSLSTRTDLVPTFYTDKSMTNRELSFWAEKIGMMADALLAEMGRNDERK